MKEKFKRFKNERTVVNVRSQKQIVDYLKYKEEEKEK